MGRTYRIDLAEVPWPASILQCRNMLDVMKPTEALSVTMTDGDVFKNLVLLFGTLPGTELTARHTDRGYDIHLVKKPPRPGGPAGRAVREARSG